MVFIPGPGPAAPPSVAPAGTGPDLSFAETQVNRLMDEACSISRNVGSDSDAVLDQATGQLVQAGPAVVYVGKCSVTGGGGGSTDEEGHQLTTLTDSYQLGLPLAWFRANPSQEPQEGDVVLITSSRRDPALVGRSYTIKEIDAKTFSVQRKCYLRLRS